MRPYGPRTLVGIMSALRKWGTTPAGGFKALAVRNPNGIAIIDERGEVTFARSAPPYQCSGAIPAGSWRLRG